MTVQILYNLQNHPNFHSEERLVILPRGRERSGGLQVSILLVYDKNRINNGFRELVAWRNVRPDAPSLSPGPAGLIIGTFYIGLFCSEKSPHFLSNLYSRLLGEKLIISTKPGKKVCVGVWGDLLPGLNPP